MRLAVLLCLFLLLACDGGSSPTAPLLPPADIAGTWKGTVSSGTTEAGLQATISQNGNAATGTWSIPSKGENGTFSGTVTGHSFTFERAHGTINDEATRMSGTYRKESVTATFVLDKQ